MRSVDQINKRLNALEAKVSSTVVGVVISDEGSHHATIYLTDPAHPLLHVPCVSSYYPRAGQAVRVQRSGNKLLILGSTDFDQNVTISNAAPPNPFPGQLWYDLNESALKAWSGGAWVKLGAVDGTARDAATTASKKADQGIVSANGKNHSYYQPTDPTLDVPPHVFAEGDLWFDTDDGYHLYIYALTPAPPGFKDARDALINSTIVDVQSIRGSLNKIYYRPAPGPTSPDPGPPIRPLIDGDLWFDTTISGTPPVALNKQYIWKIVSGVGSWVASQDAMIQQALTGSSAALTSANGKNKNYYQTTAPTGTFTIGDLWFDTGHSNAIMIRNAGNTAWVAAPLGTDAIGNINANQINAGMLNANVVATNALSANSVDAINVQAGTLKSTVINTGQISTTQLIAGTALITNAMITSLDAGKIVAGVITAAQYMTIQHSTPVASDALLIKNGNITITNTALSASVPALTITNGAVLVNNDIFAGGNLYGAAVGTSVRLQSGAELWAPSNVNTNNCIYIHSGQVNFGQTLIHNTGSAHLMLSGGDSGTIQYTGSSSIRYKTDVQTLSDELLDAHKLLDIPVRQFKYKEDYLTDTDHRYAIAMPGFIAEEVAEHYPIAADLDNDGRPETWNERMLIPPMLALIQEQHKRIEDQHRRIKALEERK